MILALDTDQARRAARQRSIDKYQQTKEQLQSALTSAEALYQFEQLAIDHCPPSALLKGDQIEPIILKAGFAMEAEIQKDLRLYNHPEQFWLTIYLEPDSYLNLYWECEELPGAIRFVPRAASAGLIQNGPPDQQLIEGWLATAMAGEPRIIELPPG